MANLFKKLKKIDKQIQEKKSELSDTENPLNGYYLKIGNESDRKRDLLEIQIELKTLYSLKYSLLESLQRKINFDKAKISGFERDLTLIINS